MADSAPPSTMEAKPRKRPWFQVHLSTCIVLMFVAGGLIWVNARKAQIWEHVEGGEAIRHLECRGWPMVLHQQPFYLLPGGPTPKPLLNVLGLGVDALVLVGILGAVAFACEWYIRHRERRRE